MSVRKEKYGSKKGEEGHEEKKNGFSLELECGEKAEKVKVREGGSSCKLEAGSWIVEPSMELDES